MSELEQGVARGPTLTVDATGRIIAWSAEAEAMLGHGAADALGQPITLIIPAHLRGAHDAGFARFAKTDESRLPEVVPTSALHRDGHIVRVNISVRPVRDAEGVIVAVDAMMSL